MSTNPPPILPSLTTKTDQRHSFPAAENAILAYWNEIDAFETSQKLNAEKPKFKFYDGPPFATGLPHYGHLLAGSIKDMITRFAHSTGHSVERRFGWDCHGLPIEYEIDKKFEIKSPQDVQNMGLKTYNKHCRDIVMRYSSEWEQTVVRMGRWIDFRNDYKTLDTDFMESVWWVFKTLWDKGQVYEGFKVMPYSYALSTPLSNFESNLNYKDVADPAATVGFELVDQPGVMLLAWTTTPWTLPSNLALCVNPEFEYAKIKDLDSGRIYVFLEKRKEVVFEKPKAAKYEVLEKFTGASMVGWKYKPLFPYFRAQFEKQAFRIVSDAYVSDAAGTGIVHQAPAFGEDDHRICKAAGIITAQQAPPCPLDASAKYTAEVADFEGIFVKDADDKIMAHLKQSGNLIKKANITHSYPFCWRSDTPLINRTIPSWFVKVEEIIDKLLANNAKMNWIPGFVKEKRFANWITSSRDWAISRNRYWGTPLPLWRSEDGEETVAIGSVEELRTLSGDQSIKDLHRDSIDDITIPSKQGKGRLRRVPEVFDCWFESGSMPYAQQHYPFENKEEFASKFPADFIAEGLDQTRGWFYTLLVLSTHLFDQPPAMNVIVNGLVLAADGKKMAKRLKNYPEPGIILETYGADALRLYLVNSPVVRAEPLAFKEAGVKDLLKDVFIPWLNAYRFFAAQAQLVKQEHNHDFKWNSDTKSSNVMDQWILASTASLVKFVRGEMQGYRLYTVVPKLLHMIEELTNWYIRFNRKRLKAENGLEDALLALNTLFDTLFTLTRCMTCFVPFVTEHFYQEMRAFIPEDHFKQDSRSVHFLPFPEENDKVSNPAIERAVARMQRVIVLGRVLREKNEVVTKQPLRKMILVSNDQEFLSDVESLSSYILEELNVRELEVSSDETKYGVKYTGAPDWKTLGTKYKKSVQQLKPALKALASDRYKQFMQEGGIDIVEGIRLGLEDVKISQYVDEIILKEMGTHWGSGTDSSQGEGVHLFMDLHQDAALKIDGAARELYGRIQKLRKHAGLNILERVEYYYDCTTNEEMNEIIKGTEALTKQPFVKCVPETKDKAISSEEIQVLDSMPVTIYLVRP